jgi:hypothetical protein
LIRIRTLLASLSLAALAACSGGASDEAPPAASLVYTEPAATAHDWKLQRDTSSTDTRLVLKLVGPSDGTKYRGIGFTLAFDPAKVKAAQFLDEQGQPAGYFRDSGVFSDKNNAGGDMPVSLQAGGVNNDKLMVGVFQKTDEIAWGVDRGATAKDASRGVLTVALELNPAQAAQPGGVSLAVVKAKLIPEMLDREMSKRKMSDVSIKVGSLSLK